MPFIATLAMLVAARGLAQRISDRKTQLVRPENDAIVELSTTRVLGLPLLVYIFAAVVVAGWLLLNRTTFGRRTFAVGGNPEAARLAGIDVRRHTLLLYALSGLCCGIAAIMHHGPDHHRLQHPRRPLRARRDRRGRSSAARCSPAAAARIVGSILGVLVFTLITNLFILNNLHDQRPAHRQGRRSSSPPCCCSAAARPLAHLDARATPVTPPASPSHQRARHA